MIEVGKLGPIDPAIRSWIAEAGIPFDSPWMYLGTPERVLSSSEPQHCLDLAYHHPGTSGAYRSLLFLPLSQFGREWDGYRLELLGIVHELDAGRFQVKPKSIVGQSGPRFRILEQPGRVMIDLELWRQRCYRPTGPKPTDVPPLIAEIHWWPGADSQQPFFRATTADPNLLAPNDIKAARSDWALLDQTDLTFDQGGRPEDSGKYDNASEPRFFDDLGVAAHAAARAGVPLSYASLARHGLLGDRRTVKKYVERFEYDLNKIEAETVKCTRRLVICQFHVRDRAKFKKNGV